MTEAPPHLCMMLQAPWDGLRVSPRNAERSKRSIHHHRIAAYEAAPAIGLVKLLAEERITGEVLGLERLVKDAFDVARRMVHEVLADIPGGIGEPVRKER